MPSFEECRKDFEASFEELTVREVAIAEYFWEGSRTQALFEANSKLGDESNEGMKRARLEVAISKLSARYPTKDEAEYLREVIAEAQG